MTEHHQEPLAPFLAVADALLAYDRCSTAELPWYLYQYAYACLDPMERAPLEEMSERREQPPSFSWPHAAAPDWGWHACDRMASGDVLVSRQDRVCRAAPGSYLQRSDGRGGVDFGIPRDIVSETRDGWIFVKSGLEGVPRGSTEIRLYVNLAANGVDVLLRRVAEAAREWGIPFSLKFPSSCDGFRRPDAGVFYLDRRNLRVLLALVERSYASLHPYLRASVPLFVRSFMPGIGFAESPSDGSSFGFERMRLCAQTLETAGWAGLDRRSIADLLKYSFDASDFTEGEYYRTPGTCWPYPLSAKATF